MVSAKSVCSVKMCSLGGLDHPLRDAGQMVQITVHILHHGVICGGARIAARADRPGGEPSEPCGSP
eukprot:4937399-Pyramimonas_sp.AAC.1